MKHHGERIVMDFRWVEAAIWNEHHARAVPPEMAAVVTGLATYAATREECGWVAFAITRELMEHASFDEFVRVVAAPALKAQIEQRDDEVVVVIDQPGVYAEA